MTDNKNHLFSAGYVDNIENYDSDYGKTEKEKYGTDVTIEELVGHYDTHFLTTDQFEELLRGLIATQRIEATDSLIKK